MRRLLVAPIVCTLVAGWEANRGEATITMDAGQATDAADVDVDALVRQAAAGDVEAFERLVHVFEKPVFNIIYRMVGNLDDAADLAQQAFIRLHKSLGSFRGESKFSTWLFALALNTCRGGLRRIRRISDAEQVRIDGDPRRGDTGSNFDPVDDRDRPEEVVHRRETVRMVERIVAGLPEEFRVVITLRDLQGLTYQEISEVLDCSMGTVKSRLARARERVKTELIQEGVLCGASR